VAQPDQVVPEGDRQPIKVPVPDNKADGDEAKASGERPECREPLVLPVAGRPALGVPLRAMRLVKGRPRGKAAELPARIVAEANL